MNDFLANVVRILNNHKLELAVFATISSFTRDAVNLYKDSVDTRGQIKGGSIFGIDWKTIRIGRNYT